MSSLNRCKFKDSFSRSGSEAVIVRRRPGHQTNSVPNIIYYKVSWSERGDSSESKKLGANCTQRHGAKCVCGVLVAYFTEVKLLLQYHGSRSKCDAYSYHTHTYIHHTIYPYIISI